MTGDATGRAEQLRAAFDEAFARAPSDRASQTVDVLAIRAGGRPYALSLSEILALHAERVVVPVPSPHPALVGLAGIRGEILPVLDLQRLLGDRADGAAPRWLALVRALDPLLVSFHEFEGYWRLPASDVTPADAHAGAGPAFGSVTRDHDTRPLLHLPSLCGALWRRPGEPPPPREEPR